MKWYYRFHNTDQDMALFLPSTIRLRHLRYSLHGPQFAVGFDQPPFSASESFDENFGALSRRSP